MKAGKFRWWIRITCFILVMTMVSTGASSSMVGGWQPQPTGQLLQAAQAYWPLCRAWPFDVSVWIARRSSNFLCTGNNNNNNNNKRENRHFLRFFFIFISTLSRTWSCPHSHPFEVALIRFFLFYLKRIHWFVYRVSASLSLSLLALLTGVHGDSDSLVRNSRKNIWPKILRLNFFFAKNAILRNPRWWKWTFSSIRIIEKKKHVWTTRKWECKNNRTRSNYIYCIFIIEKKTCLIAKFLWKKPPHYKSTRKWECKNNRIRSNSVKHYMG